MCPPHFPWRYKWPFLFRVGSFGGSPPPDLPPDLSNSLGKLLLSPHPSSDSAPHFPALGFGAWTLRVGLWHPSDSGSLGIAQVPDTFLFLDVCKCPKQCSL
ncbi:UNVERIFIED_CONTAM: hypothetical protein K2H54_034116 [Gekko kuhli]